MAVAAGEYRNYVDGSWVESESGEWFENHSPADG